MPYLAVKEYLGDSVYIATDGCTIELTTNNGYPDDPRNVIVLDAAMLEMLVRVVAVAKER